MNTPMLKVLGELSNNDQKALLLELPAKMTEELNINADGTVDTQEFLFYLIKASQKDPNKPETELSLHEEIELMLNIYDENRAANFANTIQKTN